MQPEGFFPAADVPLLMSLRAHSAALRLNSAKQSHHYPHGDCHVALTGSSQ